MLEKQVGLLNSELTALTSVNEMLKTNLINVVGAKSKLMNDIEVATRRIFNHHIRSVTSVPESGSKNKENLSNIPIPGNFRQMQNTFPRNLC